MILSNAGLNHLWENLLSLFAVLTVYLGVIFGMALEYQLKSVQVYFFAALSGIFLYISLASLFPVLHQMIEASDGLDDLPEEVEVFLILFDFSSSFDAFFNSVQSFTVLTKSKK